VTRCANGHEVPDVEVACACGAATAAEVRDGVEVASGAPIVRPLSTRRLASTKDAGVAMLVGAVLVALGTLLPWADIHLGDVSFQRTGWQLGSGGATNADPVVIVLAAGAMALAGILELAGRARGSAAVRWSLVPTVLAGFAVTRSWLASWHLSPGATVSRGLGGVVSLLGVACGLVGVVFAAQGARRRPPDRPTDRVSGDD
jgi:hypothetical protein